MKFTPGVQVAFAPPASSRTTARSSFAVISSREVG